MGEPRADLRHVVRSYGEYDEFSTGAVARREIPAPDAVLVIEFAGPLIATGAVDEGTSRVAAFLGSPARGPALTWHDGWQHCVEIRLSLLGVYRLFGPVRELAGRIAPLDALWGRAGDELTERLADADGWTRRFDILDDVFAAAVAGGPEPDAEVAHALARIDGTAGAVPIGELVTETGWSRGRLAERFRAQTGLTPKGAAGLVRFHHAVTAMSTGRPLADTALASGYYDQAHFTREFRAFAGCAPGAWLRSRLDGLVGAGIG